jgi:hypothetical protein
MYVQVSRVPPPAIRFLKWVPEGDNKLDQGKGKSVVIPRAMLSHLGSAFIGRLIGVSEENCSWGGYRGTD